MESEKGPFGKFIEKFSKTVGGWDIELLAVTPIALFLLTFLVNAFDPNAIPSVIAMLVALSPLWMPVFFFMFFWISWIDYIRFMFWFSQSYVLMEVQLPQEVYKNPGAFETFLATLHNASGETTFLARMWRGSFRPIWSLEIASNEGRIGFYIHMRRPFKSIVESRFYGLFPEAKLVEVDDYVSQVPFNLEEYDIFGSEYAKDGDQPGALPIRTYIDWKLDQDPKEELKIDPLVNILELLGQVGKNEYYWMQIILKTRRNESEWYALRFRKDKFMEDARKKINDIMTNAAKRSEELIERHHIQQGRMVSLTQFEQRHIDSIERSMSKLVFEAGIRVVYMARKENFNGINNGAIIRFFDTFKGQVSSREYNSLNVTRGTTIFNYPWQDFHGIRTRILKENVFFHYKNRAYFYVPYDQVPIFLNTEEVATIWHVPSSTIQTPGLNRVPSRRSEAPVNLPV